MSAKKFIIVFILNFLSIFLIIFSIVSIFDSYSFFNLPWNKLQYPLKNIFVQKFNTVSSKHTFKTLIIGSSRSEQFSPYQLDSLLNTRTYSASLGGIDYWFKDVLVRQFVENGEKVDRVIFVSDFYEFTEQELDVMIKYNKKLLNLMPDEVKKEQSPSLLDWFLIVLDYKTIEASLSSASLLNRNPGFKLYDDNGSLRKSKHQNFKDLKIEEFELNKEREKDYNISKDYKKYTQVVLQNANSLLENKKSYFLNLIKYLKQKNIKLDIILTPYHKTLLRDFSKNYPIKYLAYKNWIEFMNSKEGGNVRVYDLTNYTSLFGDSHQYWDDGVHFNKLSSKKILDMIYNKL